MKGLLAVFVATGLLFVESRLDATTYPGNWSNAGGLTQAMGAYITHTGPVPNPGGGLTSQRIDIDCCDSPFVICWQLVNANYLWVNDANPVNPCYAGTTTYTLTTP